MESAVRKISFCYGHRVMNHESKCSNLHGHNGVLWVHACPIQGLDTLGRVIDFSSMKKIIGNWVEENWDHTMIIFKDDRHVIELLEKIPQEKKIFIMEKNPTAENLAHYLLWDICPKLFKGMNIIIHKIVFYETENCYVEQTLNPFSEEVIKLYGNTGK